jgi:hypothetical protein
MVGQKGMKQMHRFCSGQAIGMHTVMSFGAGFNPKGPMLGLLGAHIF